MYAAAARTADQALDAGSRGKGEAPAPGWSREMPGATSGGLAEGPAGPGPGRENTQQVRFTLASNLEM